MPEQMALEGGLVEVKVLIFYEHHECFFVDCEDKNPELLAKFILDCEQSKDDFGLLAVATIDKSFEEFRAWSPHISIDPTEKTPERELMAKELGLEIDWYDPHECL